MWSDALAIDDMIVVSDMGEQWSPKTLPARIAAMLDSRIASPTPGVTALISDIRTTSGMLIGVRIVIVPHEVPVEKLIAAAMRKMIVGSSPGVMSPDVDNAAPVCALFSSDSCGHCEKFQPTWDKFKSQNGDKIKIISWKELTDKDLNS